MAAESSDQMQPPRTGSHTALTIEFRDYMREFVGTQMAIMEAQLTANDALQKQLSESTNRAVEKAEQQMNARLLTMNEFREQLQHQAASFATRAQLDDFRNAMQKMSDERQKALLERIDTIEKLNANWQGRLTVMSAGWAVVVIFISALVNFTIRSVAAAPSPVTITQPPSLPVPVIPISK